MACREALESTVDFPRAHPSPPYLNAKTNCRDNPRYRRKRDGRFQGATAVPFPGSSDGSSAIPVIHGTAA
jgi:hypothetical protein